MLNDHQKKAVAAAMGVPLTGIDWTKVNWAAILMAIADIIGALVSTNQPVQAARSVKAGCEDAHCLCLEAACFAIQSAHKSMTCSETCCQ